MQGRCARTDKQFLAHTFSRLLSAVGQLCFDVGSLYTGSNMNRQWRGV
jgi:hypothetical protein